MANGPQINLPFRLSPFLPATMASAGLAGIQKLIDPTSRVGTTLSAVEDVTKSVTGAPSAVGEYFFGARPTGTPVEGTVTDAPITSEEEDLFKRGFAAMQDQQNMGVTPPSPSVRGVGELIGFRPDVPGQTLTQFMQQGVDPQGRLIGAGTDAFAQASADREARLAQEEAGRRMQEARSRGELGTKEERLTRLAAESQGVLSQLEPTQLTYLMGQLGYDISPKGAKPTTPTTTTATTTPTEPVVAEVQEFDTYEEADASGLPIGTRVKVGGRDAIIT